MRKGPLLKRLTEQVDFESVSVRTTTRRDQKWRENDYRREEGRRRRRKGVTGREKEIKRKAM